MRERESKKRKNIFSPKNILIAFIIIIIILLIFNYFYPVLSINNKFFNQNSNQGELYTTTGGTGSSNDDKDCGGKTCGKCERCVIKSLYTQGCMRDLDNPLCGPAFDNPCGVQCGDDPCERCVVYNEKQNSCVHDWEGECRDSCYGTCDMKCETCKNGQCVPRDEVSCKNEGSWCFPNGGIRGKDLICDDGYICRIVIDDSGIKRAGCNNCNLNCGQCAVCGFERNELGIIEKQCIPVVNNKYTCHTLGSSGEYKQGKCSGGVCV